MTNTGGCGGTGLPPCAKKTDLQINRRNLPHFQLPGSTYFVTFGLISGLLSHDERQTILDAIKHFQGIRYWVTAAVIMVDHVHIILKCIASDNKIEFPLNKILQGIKGFTAREINKLRNTKVTYGLMKVMIALSETMMNIWKNGSTSVIIRLRSACVSYPKITRGSGNLGKSLKKLPD